MNKLRVLIVVISYLPIRIPSDKQFISDLIKHLPDDIEPVVWTLNEAEPSTRIARIGSKDVPVTSTCRLWHKPLCSGEDGLVPHPDHNGIRNLTEISLSLGVAAFGPLGKVIRIYKPQITHFTDHVGPALRLIKRLFPHIAITCAKPTARIPSSKHHFLYQKLLRFSLDAADAIVTYNRGCKSVLSHAGISERKLHVIPWGVDYPSPLNQEKIHLIRQRYGCSPDELLLVGSVRGSRRNYLCESVNVAKMVAQHTSIRFVFAVKPTRFREKDLQLSSKKVWVVKGPSDFYDLLASADAIFCARDSLNSFILPPLVWLEAMIRGTPVITMFDPGVEEIIKNGRTGMLYRNLNEVPDVLRKLLHRELLASLQNGAQQLVLEKYDIKQSAERYGTLWRSISIKRSALS